MKTLFAVLAFLLAAAQAQAGPYCDRLYRNRKTRENVICSFVESMGYINRFTVDNICQFACSQRHVMVMLSRLDNAGFSVDPSAGGGCGTRAIAANLYRLGDVSLAQAVAYVAEASTSSVDGCQ